MDKILVEICSGTACYVMGGSELLLLEENLPENLRDKVEIEGRTCIEECKHGENGKAPFVKVNGELVSSASIPTVIEKIQQILGVN
ncbi:MAG: hypothetical protein IAA81_06170 [Spirochaetes bacterium]|uniref:Uncharacterized protein n=1 Tax=Candidatus Gallitreponema excrementavium TaxID=2840840 RepID=A0A9D9HQ76_9SPIR|nr:hypothetical protein [Candidatus Gallitreponema excrementavium]